MLEAEFGDVTVTTRAAKARAWDAPPTPGRRDAFLVRRVKLPAVSQVLARGERDRLELERLRTGGQATAAITDAIYDDAANNARSVLARVEQMRGDVLLDGKVTIAELGGMEADFGMPSNHNVAAATAWTNPSADILGDLRAWAAIYRSTNGFNPGGMVISSTIFSGMLQNLAIRTLVAGAAIPAILAPEQFNSFLQAYSLPGVQHVYDAQVVDDSGTAQPILTPTKAIFVPPAGVELGYTQWGMSATALELQAAGVDFGLFDQSGQPVFGGNGSAAGITAVIDKDVRPPYREAAYVDSTVMPVLARPRGLMVGTVG